MSYKQRNGYDRWSNSSDSGDWENSGRAKYDSDGQMYRWDNYSPAGEGYHHHEWINRKNDGSYSYDHGRHSDH